VTVYGPPLVACVNTNVRIELKLELPVQLERAELVMLALRSAFSLNETTVPSVALGQVNVGVVENVVVTVAPALPEPPPLPPPELCKVQIF
jgi:hypothetical protein